MFGSWTGMDWTGLVLIGAGFESWRRRHMSTLWASYLKAIFNLANTFMRAPLIVNSFIKAYKVHNKTICLLKITH